MIILAATPIGNLGDASSRLRETFETAAVILAEDTRVTGKLLRALEVTNRPRLLSLHEHNERQQITELVERAKTEDLVLVSDAGMPTISDPGFLLVAAAATAGVAVKVIPGPSAVISALAVSGLPTDRFVFEGFLPRKQSERLTVFRRMLQEQRTMVFFESANRLAASLADCATVFGEDRLVAVCRELTKFYEEVKRATIAELLPWARAGVKGEIVLVISGAPECQITLQEGLVQVKRLVSTGWHLKDAATEVAQLTGLSKRELYQAAVHADPQFS